MPRRKQKPRTPYSDEKLYRYLQRELRRTFRNSPLRVEAWKNGAIPGRRGWYRCYVCGEPFKREDMAIDHVSPVIEPEYPGERSDFGDIARLTLFSRMFCPLSNLLPICDADHSIKTKAENALRKKWKAHFSNG